MHIKKTRGITLIALVITIILLLILGGVTISQLNSGNIFENAISVAEKSKIASKKEEIHLAIISKMTENDGDITIEKIIEKLEKDGIIDSGNSNSENGQVKTKPDGYVYEIVQDTDGKWDVNYIGKGEIDATKVTIATSVDTTNITNKVTITITAKSKSGIKSIQLPDGTSKTYARETTTATATYEVTKNGTYKFTATNNKNESEDKTVAISNILEGEIAITINPSTPTNKDVIATITWPRGNYSATKEVSINGGTTYTEYTGTTTQVTVTANCNIRARIKTTSGEIKTKTAEIINIDKTNPTVTAKQSSVTITEGDSNELSSYFNINANGKYGISNIVFTDTSNNEIITNTNILTVGMHTIRCTVIKETEATASTTIAIIVNSAKPEYTEKSWTTAGTYTWTCPKGVTQIRVAVCGGGGDGAQFKGSDGGGNTAFAGGGKGGDSSFASFKATGGFGGFYSSGKEDDPIEQGEVRPFTRYSAGSGGSPNGKENNTGFALSFVMADGNYGKGGYVNSYNTNGGSGGYNTGYVDVLEGEVYTIVVGAGGHAKYQRYCSSNDGNSGFVLIAYGGDI